MEEKTQEKSPPLPPGVFFKYIQKTGAGMRYTWLTDYAPIRPFKKDVTLSTMPIVTLFQVAFSRAVICNEAARSSIKVQGKWSSDVDIPFFSYHTYRYFGDSYRYFDDSYRYYRYHVDIFSFKMNSGTLTKYLFSYKIDSRIFKKYQLFCCMR